MFLSPMSCLRRRVIVFFSVNTILIDRIWLGISKIEVSWTAYGDRLINRPLLWNVCWRAALIPVYCFFGIAKLAFCIQCVKKYLNFSRLSIRGPEIFSFSISSNLQSKFSWILYGILNFGSVGDPRQNLLPYRLRRSTSWETYYLRAWSYTIVCFTAYLISYYVVNSNSCLRPSGLFQSCGAFLHTSYVFIRLLCFKLNPYKYLLSFTAS